MADNMGKQTVRMASWAFGC